MSQWNAIETTPACIDRLDRIDAPALFVHGAAAPLLPVASGREAAAPTRRADYVELETTAHVIDARRSRELARSTIHWMKRVGPNAFRL